MFGLSIFALVITGHFWLNFARSVGITDNNIINNINANHRTYMVCYKMLWWPK
jgi:succinate-acetate transporter protein